MRKKVFIIAEAGVNHNGDISLAKKLIEKAANAKVDAVKFQTWKTELLVTKDAKMAEYQIENTKKVESQFDMLKKLELSYKDFIELKKYCDKLNIMFMSTPDETTSATFLNNIQSIFKVGSGELTNTPFLRHIASFKKPIILSTGMGYLSEVEHALNTLLNSGTKLEDITVLHATTDYPTSPQDVNLHSMLTIRNAFPGINIGYSDHTLGIDIPIAATALGATVIEKHFTLDKKMTGPDHKASLDPEELSQMVAAIRKIELSLGDGWKKPTQEENKNRDIVRKSLFASCDIHENTIITEDMLEIKRPGTGISPTQWDNIVGKKSPKNYKKGDML